MSEYLLPPYKAFIKTSTGKIVKTDLIISSEIFKNELYLIWEEKLLGTTARFKERVVATADNPYELAK